jgi:hypothetical protein
MEDEYRYYETLGLDRNASLSEITKAYRSLAKTFHPDVSSHPRARENFQKIQQAYEALSDPKTRGEYDAYLDALEQPAHDDDAGDIHIENEFYVQNEAITIQGRDRILDSVHHVIANGQEYIEYNGEFLSYDRGDFPFDTRDIEEEFYVPDEAIAIDGEEYTFDIAHHVIINGQEYVEYNGDFLPFDKYEDHQSSSSDGGGGGFLKTVANLAIVLVIAFTLYHGYIIATSGNVAAAPESGVDIPAANLVQPTPQPTSREEKISQDIKDAINPDNPTTRNYALSLVDKSHGGTRNIAQVCDIWEKCYDEWTYISDPRGLEYFSPASTTIDLGLKGDCDDFAILIASLVEAMGGTTRVILAQGANGGGHAYTEVYVTNNKKDFDSIAQSICKRYHCKSVAYHIEYDKDKNPRYWLNLDWQSKHPGGKFYDSDGTLTAYYSNGYWYKFKSNT